MLIRIWNVWSEVTGTAKEIEWARNKLTFHTGKDRFGDDTHDCVLLVSKPLFPSGWALPLIAHARQAGISCVVKDERRKPCERNPTAQLDWLFPYQRRAVEAVIARGQGMIDAGVGGGKGEMIVALPLVLRCRWAVFVQEKSLVTMLVERYHKRAPADAPRCGIIWQGTWQIGQWLTVVSVQSLMSEWQEDRRAWSPRAQAFLDGLQGIEVDECHGSGSTSLVKILRSTPNAFFRVGFSATVTGRSDHRDHITQGHFGPVIFKITSKELETLGKVAQGQVIMKRCDQPETPPYKEGGRAAAIIHSPIRNRMVMELVKEAPKPCLVFIHETEHGEVLLKMARALGLRSEFVWGDTPTDVRQKVIDRIELGLVDVTFASNAWKQGVDITHLRSGVNAAGMMSIILAEQRRGRAVRVCHKPNCPICEKFGRKTTMVWFDFYDTDSAHRGQEPSWLARHSQQRKKAYQDKGQEVVLR